MTFRRPIIAPLLLLILTLSNIIRSIGLIRASHALGEYDLLQSLNLAIIFAIISSIAFLTLFLQALFLQAWKKPEWMVWATLVWMILYTIGFTLLPAPNRLILRITLTLILLFALSPKRLKSTSHE